MSDFDFDAPLPYDGTIASEGVAFPVIISGRDYGTFVCAYIDPLSKRAERLDKQFEAKHQRDIRLGKMKGLVRAKRFFIEHILLGWSGVLNRKGEEVPFSTEAAIAYFDGPAGDHVYAVLWENFSKPDNFVSVEFFETDADEAEGN